MTLKDSVQAGDILLICPKGGFGQLIAKFTFGMVNHAAIVYDGAKLFETDGDQFKAEFADIEKYEGRKLVIIRARYITKKIAEIQKLCKLYRGNPYSYWDIATNAFFFFLTRQIRNKAVKLFGSKRFMVCSELVSRIIYEATGNKLWKDFEGITPEDIRDIALENPSEHTVILFEPKGV